MDNLWTYQVAPVHIDYLTFSFLITYLFNLFFTINLNKPEPLEFKKFDAKIMNNFFDPKELNKEPQKK